MSFDRVAPYYDALARGVFGRSIQRAQCYFLDQIPPQARVLVIGGGTGWLLPHLLARKEVTHVTYVEASEVMLRLARQKICPLDATVKASVDFVHGNEDSLLPTDRFSAVITNFVLDMYQGDDLDRVIQTLSKHLTSDGVWLFTDFRLTEQARHRGWQRLATWAMYTFFYLTAGVRPQSLPSYHHHFTAQGFQRRHERSFFHDFIVSRVYQR